MYGDKPIDKRMITTNSMSLFPQSCSFYSWSLS